MLVVDIGQEEAYMSYVLIAPPGGGGILSYVFIAPPVKPLFNINITNNRTIS